MNQKRKLLLGGVSLVKTRLKNTGSVMVRVCDDLEPLLALSGFFPAAPFKVISLIVRYGIKNQTKPEYEPINKRHDELPIAIELNANMLQEADQTDVKLLENIFTVATLEALIAVGLRFKLPVEAFVTKRDQLVEATGIRLIEKNH